MALVLNTPFETSPSRNTIKQKCLVSLRINYTGNSQGIKQGTISSCGSGYANLRGN